MASEADDAAEAAERLEAALERIAHAAGQRAAREQAASREMPPPVGEPAGDHHASVPDELAVRLDALIHRLRTALGGTTV